MNDDDFDQGSLFDPGNPVGPTPSELDAAFADFHVDHPEVYRNLVRLAHQAKAAGHERIGIGMLYEVLRWETMVGDLSGTTYKLNNNHRSRYARMIADREPGLADIFETRELKS